MGADIAVGKPGPGRWLGGALLGLALLHACWNLLGLGSGPSRVVVGDLAYVLFPLSAAALALRRAGRTRRGRHRAGWWLLAAGLLVYGLGNAAWAHLELVARAPAFPSVADAFFIFPAPLLALGLVLVSGPRLTSRERANLLLDTGLVLIAGLLIAWAFFFPVHQAIPDQAPLVRLLATYYPLTALLACAAAVFAFLRRPEAGHERMMRPLLAGASIYWGGQFLYSYTSLIGVYHTGHWVDVPQILGVALFGVAALHGAEAPPEGAAERDQDHRGTRLLPYFAIVPVYALLFALLYREGVASTLYIISAGLLSLTALVALRQVLTAREVVAYALRLERLATVDALTDLPNHRAMQQVLELELERCRRYDLPCAVLFLDLDHFKALNDGHGHPVGDAALRAFGAVLRAHLRAVDTLGRWGGEEFVALLPQTGGAEAEALAERLRAAVATHAFTGAGLHLTCSLGVATYPADAADRAGLVAAADAAMYAAKRLGRNQVRRAGSAAVVALLDGPAAGGGREEGALVGTVAALASLIEERDAYTGQHTAAVAELALGLALALGCDAAQARLIALAGQLHDVGKVAVPDAVLLKPGPLTPVEWALIRRHPAVGAAVLALVPALRTLAPIVRAHHERWDGGGYPDGLAGAAIPLGARVLAVADAYAAMTTARVHQSARPADAALAELRRGAGSQFDPVVVAAFADVPAGMPTNLVAGGTAT